MVTGITRQVIVVKGTREDIFDQAIFLVRDKILTSGGITEEALFKEAKKIYQANPVTRHKSNLIWALSSAVATGLLGLIIGIIL